MRSDYTLGFLGGGNMASAIISGIVKTGLLPPERIKVFDIKPETMERLHLRHGIGTASSTVSLVEQCDLVVAAVKPNVMESVLSEAACYFSKDKALISIAAGWDIKRLRFFLPENCPVVRVMPNTPAMVGQGMTVIAADDALPTWVLDAAVAIFRSVGKVEQLKESLMEAVTAVSGSGPAYAYLFIEALADGGVMHGLPRDVAQRLAAQTLLGASCMVMETGSHPGALKDAVCSPGGTTIEAVYALERSAFRGAVMGAVDACAKKAESMKK